MVGVHGAREVRQRLTRVVVRPVAEQAVVLDERPGQVGRDVDRDGHDEQADDHPRDRQAAQGAGSEPRGGRRGRRRREEGGRLVGRRRRRHWAEAHPGGPGERKPGDRTQQEEPDRDLHGQREREPGGGGYGRDAAIDQRADGRPPKGVLRCHEREDAEPAENDRGADREPNLVERPRDRVGDVRDDRDDGQRHHDRDEWQIAEPGPGRHVDRDVAEDRRDPDHRDHRQEATQGAPDHDQERDPAERVQGHPLRRQTEPQKCTDQGHRDPERAAMAPDAGPQCREQGVGRDDEDADVRIVHPDPRLDEEHPVGEADDGDENPDRPAPEQDPREQEEEPRHRRPRQDTREPPGELVLPDVDAGDVSGPVERQDLLPVVGRVVPSRVHHPRRRRERQAGVRVDRPGVRFDDIHRRGRAVRCPAQDVDHLRGVVVGDAGDRPRHPHRLGVDRPVLGGVAAHRDDRDPARRVRRRVGIGGDVEPRVVDRRESEAVGRRTDAHRPAQRPRGRIDHLHAVRVGDGNLGNGVDRQPGERPVVDRLLHPGPLIGVGDRGEDGPVGRAPQAFLVRRHVPADDPGNRPGGSSRILDGVRGPDEGGSGPGRRHVAGVVELDRAQDLGRRCVEGDDPIIVEERNDGLAGRGHDQVLDGAVDLAKGDRIGRDRRRAEVPDGVQRSDVDGRDRAVAASHEQPEPGLVHSDGAGASDRDRRDQGPRVEVVRAKLGSGDDVDAVAGSVPGERRISVPRLDYRVEDRHAELAGGGDPVVTPRDEAAGHRVLREVRMRPLVDLVAHPVAPVLEELRRGPRVVDLVEVHLVRLGQSEHPHSEHRCEEDDEDPHVELVQPPRRLVVERSRPVGSDRALVELCPEPGDRAELGQRRRLGPGRQRQGCAEGHGTGGCAGSGREASDRRGNEGAGLPTPRRSVVVGLGRALGPLALVLRPGGGSRHLVGRRARVDLPFQGPLRARSELGERPERGGQPGQRDGRHALGRADRVPDPEPVGDPGIADVEGRQDDVHVEERRRRQDDVRDAPSDRDRGEDRSDGHDRIEVALVDTGGQDEERDRQDRESREHRGRRRPPGDRQADEDEGDREQPGPDVDRRDSGDHDRRRTRHDPGRRVADDRVAGPAAVRRDAGAVDRCERPGVVRVDAGVRVATGRLEDLLDQARVQDLAIRSRLDHGQAEREAQGDGRQEAGDSRCEDPDRLVGLGFPGAKAGEDPGSWRRERRVALALSGAIRPERAADRDDRHDRRQDRQLWLDQRGDHGEDRGPLRLVPPQGAQAEQQEHDPEGVHLAPEHGVEPADRVGDRECAPDEGRPPTRAQLAGHRPDEPADRDVREDRRDLDQVADPAERPADDPDDVQDIEIARGVVVEERALVEPVQALLGEVSGPCLERAEIDLEARARIQLCDDESEDEAEREDRDDRADAIPRPVGPRRRVCAPARSARRAAGRHGMDLPERALRWTAG